MENDAHDSLSTCSLGSTSEDTTTNYTESSAWTDSLLTTSLQCVGSATLQPLQLLQTADGSSVPTSDSEGGIGSILISVSAAGSLQQYCGELLEVGEGAERTHIIQLPAVDVSALGLKIEDEFEAEENFLESTTDDRVGSTQMLTEMLTTDLPKEMTVLGIPPWALRMNDYEAIGDSFRGWVNSEVQLDLLLMYHRQQTGSCWGTRQSTGSPRSSLRLMWKSQYVPFDGVPFINAGSRAVVLECQYGPRRKGNPLKRPADGMKKGEFKPTCPARIYIKKVRKYPEYKVDLEMDKKALKVAMEKKFLELKLTGLTVQGEDRWYAQLPLESAHEFHEGIVKQKVDSNTATQEQELKKDEDICPSLKRSCLDPHLAEKIRELVSQGETNVFSIRKQLRKYVENELFNSQADVPDRHNLCFFPTIQGIQNNVYEALKDIRSGALPLLALSLNFEVLNRSEKGKDDTLEGNTLLSQKELSELRTITVTLTRSNDPGQAPIISRIETQLCDGSVQVSTTLTPETFEILSQLHPSVFPPPVNLLKLASSQKASTLKPSDISEQILPNSSSTSEPFHCDNQNYTCQELSLTEEDMQVPELNLSSSLTACVSAVGPDLCHETEFVEEEASSVLSKMEVPTKDNDTDKNSEL